MSTANYLIELNNSLSQVLNSLKSKGYVIIIIGNNMNCAVMNFKLTLVTQMLKKMGLQLKLELIDDIKSYGLMTKRNKTANIISRKWILVFKKN